jgi:hypothetical protein
MALSGSWSRFGRWVEGSTRRLRHRKRDKTGIDKISRLCLTMRLTLL